MSQTLGGAPVPIDSAYPSYIKETIPKSALGYGTNNQYSNFPPKMADGRSLISSWNPESIADHRFQQEHRPEFMDRAPLNPNWMYRRYLQKNAYQIMEQNYRETANDTGSSIPLANMNVDLTKKDRNSPFLFNSLHDPSHPAGYQTSNLKELYMTREQLDARKMAPVIR